MEIGFSATEGAVLHGLLAESAGDIVLKLDANGFIVHASPNITDLGFDLSSLLFLPHIADLASASYAETVRTYSLSVFGSHPPTNWIEFPIAQAAGEKPTSKWNWHALSLRPVINDDGMPLGALGLLRSVEHLRVLEDELHATATTDSLTGLGNRKVFCAKLRRQLQQETSGMLALFEVDRFRAIYLQYGQSAADEVVWAFAQFLQAMSLPGQELAHLEGGRFGVILPDISAKAARRWCEDAIETFAALAIGSTPGDLELSANVGLARLEGTVDKAFKQAELALVMARASGGMRVAMGSSFAKPVVFRERPMVTELGASFAAR